MKTLRIKLKQNQAHYRKEETITNKMTYPLPPFSTVIGAIHVACGFTEYHPMDISVQGKYGAMQREPYVNHAILNSVMDDRGILIKLVNPDMVSAGHTIVAKAQKSQGNSFVNGTTIEVVNQPVLDEYRELKAKTKLFEQEKKVVDAKLKDIAEAKKIKNKLLKEFDKKSTEYTALKNEIKLLDDEKKQLNDDFKERRNNEVTIPYSYFASLTKSLQYYEVLYDVELVIHVRSDDDTIDIIKANINNLTAIGRSEDFVELEECEEVNLIQEFGYQEKEYSAYINCNLLRKKVVFLGKHCQDDVNYNGTVYAINKDYVIENNKRKFNQCFVVYTDQFGVMKRTLRHLAKLPESARNKLYFDEKYKNIVNFN